MFPCNSTLYFYKLLKCPDEISQILSLSDFLQINLRNIFSTYHHIIYKKNIQIEFSILFFDKATILELYIMWKLNFVLDSFVSIEACTSISG